MRTNSMFHRPMKLLAAGGLLFTALLAGFAQAQIIGSRHDLTAPGVGKIHTLDANAQPCAFCHTPHGSSASAQLWNRGAAVGTGAGLFTVYANTWGTLDGAPASQPGANSVLCLSCHDGATALDLIINRPGSGGLNPLGLSAGYAFVNNGASNVMLSTSAGNLGTTLVNDHPIGVPFCGGVTTPGTCNDGDFKTAAVYLNTALTFPSTAAATGTGWWIDTGALSGGTAGTVRTKHDLPLYQAGAAVIPRVECATCHEPHNTANGTFLRIANAASALCTTCHNK